LERILVAPCAGGPTGGQALTALADGLAVA
jgi:hypothetical protein